MVRTVVDSCKDIQYSDRRGRCAQNSGLWKAPYLVVEPDRGMVLETHHDFLPVCQYPPDVYPNCREIGALVRFRDGLITEVYKRIIVKAV